MAVSNLDAKSVEQNFRSGLEDVAAIVQRLEPYCQTTAELAEMIELAKRNDGQLRILMEKVLQGKR